jgi:hypothetical protein
LGGSHFFVIFFKRLFYSVPWYAFTLPFSFSFSSCLSVDFGIVGILVSFNSSIRPALPLLDREQALVSVYIAGDGVEDRE